MSIRVLIVGLGKIGMSYDIHLPNKYIYTHARAFSHHPKFELVAAVEPKIERRKLFSNHYDCPVYSKLGAALKDHAADIIIISSGTKHHLQILQQVLEQSNPKAILCEKPLAYDINDAKQIVEECYRRDLKLYVNYMRRSDSGVIEIKRRISAGEFGKVIKGLVWYSKGFLHNGSHFFNLLEYWFGSIRGSTVINKGRLWDDCDPEPDVQVNFDAGNILFLSAWEEKFSHYNIELLTQNGRLRYDNAGGKIEWQSVQPDPSFADYNVLAAQPEVIASGMDRYQWQVAEQLANVFSGKDAQLCSGQEALQTLVAMKQIIE